MTLRLPAGFALVANGRPIARAGAEPVVVDSDDALYPTIVTDRVLRPATARQGEHVVHYLHRRPRPPGSDDKPLPYVREDIAALVLDTARRALAFADAVLPPGSPARALPVTLVEAPLRHELVQEHGDVILVSDQIFGIFPFNRLRKYHHLQIARAIFTVVADAAVRAHETPTDRARAAGVLAAHLTELFARARFDRLEYAPDILRPFDFVPAVDQMLYAPLLASSQSYFGDVDDRDAIRDGVRAWVAVGPTPAFVYNKLADLLGPQRFAAAARAMLRDGTPLRTAAARAYGADLAWFWQQWLNWYLGVSWPSVNYRVQSVTETPTADRQPRQHRRPPRGRDRCASPSRCWSKIARAARARCAGTTAPTRTASTSSCPRACAPSSSIRAAAWRNRRSARCAGRTIRAWTTARRRAGVSSTRGSARCSTSRS